MEVEGEQHLEENGDNDYEEEDVWLGDCMFEDRNNQEKYFRSFTRSKGSLELFSVEVGSFVYINNFIGLVCCFWEKDSQKQVEVRNIYRPHQTIEGIQPYHGNAEVLLSLIVTEHSTSLIQGLVRPSSPFLFFLPIPLISYHIHIHFYFYLHLLFTLLLRLFE